MSVGEEIITWDEKKAVSEELIKNAQSYSDEAYHSFSEHRGLYILSYAGSELGGNLWQNPEPSIIYIGRTGSDSKRHWQNNTGVSTVRRSLAAMLAGSLSLEAIPGSDQPNAKDRYSNYRLTEESESRLTQWMQENIKLTFLELPKENIDSSYQALIEYNTPKLNFQDNPNNTYGQQIKKYRKIMSDMAKTYDAKQQAVAQ